MGVTIAVSLWLAFIVFRILLLPYTLYLIFHDLSASPAETSGKVPLSIITFNVVTIALVLIESSLWFMPINKGLIKAIKGEQIEIEARSALGDTSEPFLLEWQ